MAWDKACERKIIGKLMKFFGAFPVNIEHGGKESYKKSIEILREGGTLVIFPEGSRNRDQEGFLPFKKGGFVMAIDAQVPVVPVVIESYRRLYDKAARKMTSGTLRVQVLPAIPVRQ